MMHIVTGWNWNPQTGKKKTEMWYLFSLFYVLYVLWMFDTFHIIHYNSSYNNPSVSTASAEWYLIFSNTANMYPFV